jgi:hypothetical protein
MNDELVTIATFDNTIEANLARNQLAAAGIRATLVDEHTVGMNWGLSNAIGGVKLIVREEDYEDASRVLAGSGDEQELDTEGQTFLEPEASDADGHESADEEFDRDDARPLSEPKGGPTQREQDAERAFRAAFFGILLQPLQLYAAWLLLGVWLSAERLGPDYRRMAWRALGISGMFLFLWLITIKMMFFSDYYYYYDY